MFQSVRSRPAINIERAPMTTIAHTDVSALRITIAILAVFIVVAVLPMALGYLWIFYQRGTRQHQRHESGQSIGLVIMDSNVGIDVHYSPCAGDVEEARDIENRHSAETICSPLSPGQAW